jgi:hypothetical protein
VNLDVKHSLTGTMLAYASNPIEREMLSLRKPDKLHPAERYDWLLGLVIYGIIAILIALRLLV